MTDKTEYPYCKTCDHFFADKEVFNKHPCEQLKAENYTCRECGQTVYGEENPIPNELEQLRKANRKLTTAVYDLIRGNCCNCCDNCYPKYIELLNELAGEK